MHSPLPPAQQQRPAGPPRPPPFFFFFKKKTSINQSINHSNLGASPRPPSNDTVLQQRLEVLVAGGGGALLVAARERRVDVHAGQRRHGLLAVGVRLLAQRQLRGRGGARGLLGDEEGHQEGHHHRARPQEEGRAGDERVLGGGREGERAPRSGDLSTGISSQRLTDFTFIT